MEDNCKKKNGEILGKIIFHLSEARRLFNKLEYGRVSELEQREWQNAIKLCKDAINFSMEKLMGKIVR